MRLVVSCFLIQRLELGSCLVACHMLVLLARKRLVSSQSERGQEGGPFQRPALRGEGTLRPAINPSSYWLLGESTIDQCCPVELSTVIEMLCICTKSHIHVALEYLKCD